MEIEIVIETWNGKWRFEIRDKSEGDIIQSGERDSFSGCAAECLEYVAENAVQQSVEQTGLCPECDAPNFDVNSACLQCGYH